LSLTVLYLFGAVSVVAVIASAMTSFALSAMVTALGARVLEVAPADTGDANAGTSTAFNVGITAGALIGAALVDGPGVRSTALVGASIGALGFAVVAGEPLLARSGPRRQTRVEGERQVAGGDRLDADGV
jgi:predicted MFS family arabinose efflux permease